MYILGMATVILKWNPAISSYTLGRSDHGFEQAREEKNYMLNWSIWEHEQVHAGDRFFMLRVGDGNTGIVMSGQVVSEPYRDEDWSGKGRITYYADILPDFMIDSEQGPVLETATLQGEMPDFQWDGGHSGMILPESHIDKLEWLWCDFLFRCYYLAYSEALVCNVPRLPSPEVFHFYRNYAPIPMQLSLIQERGGTCEICGYSYGEIFKDGLGMHHLYHIFEGDGNIENDGPRKHFHCVCKNCMNYHENMPPAEIGEDREIPAYFEDLLAARAT